MATNGLQQKPCCVWRTTVLSSLCAKLLVDGRSLARRLIKRQIISMSFWYNAFGAAEIHMVAPKLKSSNTVAQFWLCFPFSLVVMANLWTSWSLRTSGIALQFVERLWILLCQNLCITPQDRSASFTSRAQSNVELYRPVDATVTEPSQHQVLSQLELASKWKCRTKHKTYGST